ncbi:MAG: ATP-binding protein [Gemmatimonadota bacterium]
MPDAANPELLSGHRTLGVAPSHEHEWLAAHGTRRTLTPGEVLTAKGTLADAMHVYLSGHVVIRVDRGAGSHKIFEWRGGEVGGMLPYSRGARAPNDAVAVEETVVLMVPRDLMDEMIHMCPVATATLVHVMVDRAREFNASDLRDEKLVSLGRLAAGLAHELNNPASAAVRSAKLLAAGLNAAEQASSALGAAHLADAQLAAIDRVRAQCAESVVVPRSAIERADREDLFGDWLVEHGANEGCAVPLAETSVTLEMLDELGAAVSGPALDASLRWISLGCHVRALASEIETATARIHELVASIKGFTFMDRAPNPEAVDIRRGINDTFMMLGAKCRAKGADVKVQFAADLPCAHAVGAELNQVWMNLIDNALDALPVGGHLLVDASEERGRVVVRVIDDGSGIPADVKERIFEPFFTTKGVGEGTGLGLDIVSRILRRHDGDIEVDSEPGRTEFRVSLPLERRAAAM